MNIDENKKKLIKKIGLRRFHKFMMANTKLYNKLCKECRAKVFKNSAISFDNYCSKCQGFAEKYLGEFRK